MLERENCWGDRRGWGLLSVSKYHVDTSSSNIHLYNCKSVMQYYLLQRNPFCSRSEHACCFSSVGARCCRSVTDQAHVLRSCMSTGLHQDIHLDGCPTVFAFFYPLHACIMNIISLHQRICLVLLLIIPAQ